MSNGELWSVDLWRAECTERGYSIRSLAAAINCDEKLRPGSLVWRSDVFDE